MTPLLQQLDARDRALFLRYAARVEHRDGGLRFWRLITHAGGARATIGLSIASAALPAISVAIAWRTLLLLGVSHLVVQVVKRTVGRPRPTLHHPFAALVDIPDRFSFPSGHACAIMAVAVSLSVALPAVAIPLLTLAIVVGFSRVVLGVHYPGDVLAGQMIALVSAYPFLA
jgi:undecaprenyl-diphosphatase